jgi:hypothetical protein
MKIIRTSLALLAICTFCLMVGCAASTPEKTPESEIISGTGTGTVNGPRYLDGRPLGAPGPNGTVEKPNK